MTLAGLGVAVVDDLRGRIGGPGDQAHGVGVRTQQHVGVGGRNQVVVILGIIAGDGSGENAFRQPRAVIVRKLVSWNDLAARVAGDVRYEAFDFGDVAVLQPAQQRVFAGLGVDGGWRGFSLSDRAFGGCFAGWGFRAHAVIVSVGWRVVGRRRRRHEKCPDRKHSRARATLDAIAPRAGTDPWNA